MLRLALASLHLLALGIGLGAVMNRAAALREPITPASLRRVFRSDTMWGIAAVVWIGTGLWRVIGQTEKSTAYYLHNRVFWTKMGLLLAILVLEVWPMVTLIRWRIATARHGAPDTSVWTGPARRIAAISALQAVLVVAMVVVATAMARGYGARG
jgi:putative membrane protein